MMRLANVRDLCNFAAYVNAGNDCAGFSASSASTTDALTETVLKKFFPVVQSAGFFFCNML